MTGLRLTGVEKTYGSLRALEGLDLEIGEGELVTLVGPSGSGKTTALRVVAGLEPVTAGRIEIGDRDVTDLPSARRNVAMVFQGYALFPHFTAAENIGFGLSVRRTPADEVKRRVAAAAELTGAAPFLDRRPSELSGGERQRVALARALAREPDVFLLDEPLASLDAPLRVQTRAQIKRLHASVGVTMLYVTHDQVEALTMGDRVAVLDRGRIQQVGTPDEVYRRPATRFVATFIGSPGMNLIPATGSRGSVRGGPFTLRRRAPEGPLELGVRPEHVRIGGTRARPNAVVDLVEPAGGETFVHADADGIRLIARTTGPAPHPGDPVSLSASAGDLHLFDGRTGRRVEP